MIENAIIFSKEIKDLVLSSSFGNIDISSDKFTVIVESIKEVAVKDEKGLNIIDLAGGLNAFIYSTNRFSVILIFNQKLDEKQTKEWEKVAKEIENRFNRVYDPWDVDNEKYLGFKKTLDDIINWQLEEESPIDKLKDALW